jgi:hypothetical protein
MQYFNVHVPHMHNYITGIFSALGIIEREGFRVEGKQGLRGEERTLQPRLCAGERGYEASLRIFLENEMCLMKGKSFCSDNFIILIPV